VLVDGERTRVPPTLKGVPRNARRAKPLEIVGSADTASASSVPEGPVQPTSRTIYMIIAATLATFRRKRPRPRRA